MGPMKSQSILKSQRRSIPVSAVSTPPNPEETLRMRYRPQSLRPRRPVLAGHFDVLELDPGCSYKDRSTRSESKHVLKRWKHRRAIIRDKKASHHCAP